MSPGLASGLTMTKRVRGLDSGVAALCVAGLGQIGRNAGGADCRSTTVFAGWENSVAQRDSRARAVVPPMSRGRSCQTFCAFGVKLVSFEVENCFAAQGGGMFLPSAWARTSPGTDRMTDQGELWNSPASNERLGEQDA